MANVRIKCEGAHFHNDGQTATEKKLCRESEHSVYIQNKSVIEHAASKINGGDGSIAEAEAWS